MSTSTTAGAATTATAAGPASPARDDILARLWARTTRVGECWQWTGYLNNAGYGRLSVDGRHVRTHRLAYALLVRPIPAGLSLDHLCRNRACWNPSHLEPVTSAVNTLRGEGVSAQNARKSRCPQGHPYNDANTVIRPNGRRRCRACHNASTNRKVRNR